MDVNDPRIIHAENLRAERLGELHRGKKFHDMQLAVFNAIFRDGYKRIFIRKGRKGGGTECVMYPVARIIGTKPNAAAYIIGPTQKAQSEIIWDNRRIHRYLPAEWGVNPNEQQKRIRLNNESFVKIEGADNPDAARGWEGDIFVWDEYKDHNPLAMEACFPNVIARDGIWIVLGTPPTQKTNHYYIKEQEIRNDPDWKFFHWTSWDNPFLPGGHELLQKEKDKYYARGDWDLWEIEYEARYVFNAKRKVLPNLTDKNKASRAELLQMISRDAKHMKWGCIIDPGYSSRFGVLYMAYNPYTAQMFRLDEIYCDERSELAAKDIWPVIREKQKRLWDGKWWTVYDSAAKGFATEVHAIARDSGDPVALIPTVKSSKRSKDEDDYFRLINGSYAEQGQSWVAHECVNYIIEAENYETDENDNYPDENNHLLDCDRYWHKFVGFTDVLKQGQTIVTPLHPQPTRLKDELNEIKQKQDWVGFGGEDAGFGIGDIDGGSW